MDGRVFIAWICETRQGKEPHRWVYQNLGAAIIKDHKVGGLEKQKLLSQSSGDQKSKIKLLAGPYSL